MRQSRRNVEKFLSGRCARLVRLASVAAFLVLAGQVAFAGNDIEIAASDDDANAESAALAFTERADEDLLLLEVLLNDFVLVDAMVAYLSGSSIVLPLRDLTDVLDFAIGVSTDSGTASGWFLSENRLFSLNVGRGEVILDGKVQRFDPRLVEVQFEDIFVDIRLLARWFPINLDFDLSNSMIRIESREPLPIELRIAREDYRQRVLSKTGSDPTTNLQDIEIPFKPFSVPLIDVNAQTTVDRDENGDTQFASEHNVTMTGDLAWTNVEVFVGGDNRDKADEVRLRLDRKDPNGNALAGLPFGLSQLDVNEASVGDIFSPQLSLVSRTELGRGIAVSNMPIDAPTEFDRITLTGDLPLGWEAEIYRNEVLLDFQSSRGDGQYEFEDVPLIFGVNVIRLVFYGPQGQVNEEIRQFTVGPGQTTAGDLNLRFVANQHDRPFLVRDEGADDDLEGDGRLFLETQYGVSKNLTVGGNLVQLPFADGLERYVSAAANFTFGEYFGRADFVRQLGAGWANRLSLQTSQFGLNWLVEHSTFNNFWGCPR